MNLRRILATSLSSALCVAMLVAGWPAYAVAPDTSQPVLLEADKFRYDTEKAIVTPRGMRK